MADGRHCENRKYAMSLGYNKNVLYLRPTILAERYLRFYRCHGPYMFDKTGKVFYI